MTLKSGAWPAHRLVGTGLQILKSSKRTQELRVMVKSVRISHECNQQNYKQESFRIFGNEVPTGSQPGLQQVKKLATPKEVKDGRLRQY